MSEPVVAKHAEALASDAMAKTEAANVVSDARKDEIDSLPKFPPKVSAREMMRASSSNCKSTPESG